MVFLNNNRVRLDQIRFLQNTFSDREFQGNFLICGFLGLFMADFGIFAIFRCGGLLLTKIECQAVFTSRENLKFAFTTKVVSTDHHRLFLEIDSMLY